MYREKRARTDYAQHARREHPRDARVAHPDDPGAPCRDEIGDEELGRSVSESGRGLPRSKGREATNEHAPSPAARRCSTP